jgi:FtsH-binding integral membrane protein
MSNHAASVPLPLVNGVEPFVRQTYWIFLTTLVAIIALGFASHYFLPTTSFGPLGVADSLIWVLCGWFGWRRPVILTLPLFSIITGLFLGQLAARYSPPTFAAASVLTLVAFAGLSAFVHFTKQSFTFLRGFLTVSFFVMLGGCLIFFFMPVRPAMILLTAFGTIVFGCWVLYDTSQIMERADDELTPAIAALELMIDIVGLHRWLMNLLDLQERD